MLFFKLVEFASIHIFDYILTFILQRFYSQKCKKLVLKAFKHLTHKFNQF